MKKYILLLTTFSMIILNANDSIKINTFCSDSNKKEFTFKLKSNKLDLSKDAVQDNLGGYVDIPEDRYYIKTKTKVYRLDGVVTNDYKNNIKQFIANINNDPNKFIKIKELYSLKEKKDLKLIQKINLEIDSSKNKTTTNTITIYFDKEDFEKEYKKCK